MVKIAPSIASGPLTNLEATLQTLESAGSDVIHIDIEDGSFVLVMNLGVKIIKEIRPLTRLPLDVHLMMVNPEWLIPELAKMGADSVSVHLEACPYPRRILGLITQLGMRAGLAFNPATPIPPLDFCLPHLAFLLVLSTEPEAGDCPFLPAMLSKVTQGKQQPGMGKLEWVMDGGITSENIKKGVDAGVEMEDLTISEKNILVNETVQSGEEIIRKLGGLLYNNNYVKDTYVQAVLDREKVFPTGLQIPSLGFAIPHTDAKHVIQSAVAVATLTCPVMFKAMDNPEVDIPVTIVMMLAISDPKKVIESLTKVISILEYESTIDRIKNATTKQEIQEAIGEHIRRITEQRSASPTNFTIDH